MRKKLYQPVRFVAWAGLFIALIFSFYTESWSASDYPKKSIRVIVPFSPGGSTDLRIRGLAPYMQKELGVSVVVDNRPGARGAIGYTKTFKAKPDGYTLGLVNVPSPQNLEYMQKTAYKTSEFTHIAAVFKMNIVLLVNAETWNTFGEFMQAAKRQKMKMGMTTKAGNSYLLGRIFEKNVGIKINWIPYSGGSRSLAALAGKHIDAVMSVPISARSLVNAGKIKPLLMLSTDPYPGHPEVVTIDKCGYKIDTYSAYFGLVGPPGISADKVKILEAAVMKAVKDPGFLKWAEKMGQLNVLVPMSSEEFKKQTEYLYSIVEKYKGYLKD